MITDTQMKRHCASARMAGVRKFWNYTIKSFNDSANDFQLEMWFGKEIHNTSTIGRIKKLVALRDEFISSGNWFGQCKACANIKRECNKARALKKFWN